MQFSRLVHLKEYGQLTELLFSHSLSRRISI